MLMLSLLIFCTFRSRCGLESEHTTPVDVAAWACVHTLSSPDSISSFVCFSMLPEHQLQAKAAATAAKGAGAPSTPSFSLSQNHTHRGALSSRSFFIRSLTHWLTPLV